MFRDLRLALKRLLRQPTYTFVTVAILALGLGATTAMFSVTNEAMLRPLPYPRPDALMQLRVEVGPPEASVTALPPFVFRHLREHNQVLEGIAAVASSGKGLGYPGQPAEVEVSLLNVSADFFPMLGMQPSLGRVPSPDEDQEGRNQVVVLSDRLWRQDKPSVVIFGHSWGSILGALYAHRFPQKVAAYVGGAQIGDWPVAESASYRFAVAEAQRLRNEKALKKLREIGPPPYSADAVFIERTCVLRLEGRMGAGGMWKTVAPFLLGPESSLVDLVGTMRGFRFTMRAMWPEVSRLNLLKLVPALQMPVFFLLGRKDHWVPSETSMAYFDALTAPSKEVIWFEKSGHEMFVDEPTRFLEAMATRVRPACRVDSTQPYTPPRPPEA